MSLTRRTEHGAVATRYELPDRGIVVQFDEPEELRDSPNTATVFELEDNTGNTVRISISDFYAVAQMFLDLGLEGVDEAS
jgi:hypothetical protein